LICSTPSYVYPVHSGILHYLYCRIYGSVEKSLRDISRNDWRASYTIRFLNYNASYDVVKSRHYHFLLNDLISLSKTIPRTLHLWQTQRVPPTYPLCPLGAQVRCWTELLVVMKQLALLNFAICIVIRLLSAQKVDLLL